MTKFKLGNRVWCKRFGACTVVEESPLLVYSDVMHGTLKCINPDELIFWAEREEFLKAYSEIKDSLQSSWDVIAKHDCNRRCTECLLDINGDCIEDLIRVIINKINEVTD